MSSELLLLIFSAAAIGFVHTLLGPDHYLPFIVMSKAGKWNMKKTVGITILSGIGHVGSSVVLGFFGIAFGIALTNLTHIESFRGELAGYFLIVFGLLYTIYGIKSATRNKPHKHLHHHQDGTLHEHSHNHKAEHLHVHETVENSNLTPWILFTIFAFGPCEPLIPILMYPAASESVWGTVIVSIVFGIVTIVTMLTVVVITVKGLEIIPIKKYERFTHTFAGLTVLFSGLAVQFLGL